MKMMRCEIRGRDMSGKRMLPVLPTAPFFCPFLFVLEHLSSSLSCASSKRRDVKISMRNYVDGQSKFSGISMETESYSVGFYDDKNT